MPTNPLTKKGYKDLDQVTDVLALILKKYRVMQNAKSSLDATYKILFGNSILKICLP